MAKNKTKTGEKVPGKKLNRLLVEEKLESAFSELKPLVSKKKFDEAIKKASKSLNKDFSKKSLDNFRKQHASVPPEEQIKDDTNQLIEELP